MFITVSKSCLSIRGNTILFELSKRSDGLSVHSGFDEGTTNMANISEKERINGHCVKSTEVVVCFIVDTTYPRFLYEDNVFCPFQNQIYVELSE